MDEFHKRGNQSLEESLKRASLRLSCPKERLLTRKRILCIPMFASCRNRHIFTLFGMQPVKERRSTGSLRDDVKLSKEKYSSCLGDRLQEILELISKKSQDSQELPQGKAQLFWVSYLSHGYMLGTILKITSSSHIRSKDYLSGDEDSKNTLSKARFDKLF